MSSVEHPLSLNSEQHHAFAETVAWHTVTVFPRAGAREHRPRGTGSLNSQLAWDRRVVGTVGS